MIKAKFSSALIGALFVGTVGMTGVMAAVGVDQTPIQAFRAIFSSEPDVASAPDAGELPVQKIVSAQPQPEALDRQFRSYRLRLAEDGMLPGRLSVIDPASGALIPNPAVRVYFVQNGRTITSASPDVGGVFQVANLTPGVYSMVAAGPGGFMASALEVMPFLGNVQAGVNDADATVKLVNFQVEATALGIDGAVVPPNNFNALRSVIQNYVPAAQSSAQFIAPDPVIPPDPGAPADDADAPADEGAFAGGEPTAGLQQHVVFLQPGGALHGRLRRIHPESGRPVRVRRVNIFLMQNDQVVGQSPVDESGAFAVPGLEPGVYSLAAAGLEGFAAFSVQAIIPPATAAQGEGAVRPVALLNQAQPDGLNDLDIALIPPEDFAEMLRIFDANIPGGLTGLEGPVGPEAAPGAGAGAGGGGFGGGGGGGDGLGLLLGAAGLAAGIAALADDDGDGDGRLGSPFDPFFPEAFFGKDPDVFFEEQQNASLDTFLEGPPSP